MVEILKRYYKLIVVMVFLVAAIFYGQFVYSSGVVKSLGEEKIEENFNSLVSQINHWLEHKESAIEESSLFISYLNNEKEVLNYLKGKLNENPEFNSIYFLTPENKMINASGYVPSPDIDFRTRPWYLKAMNTQGTIFTDVFMNATETELIVSIATPVINSEGKILGVIAIVDDENRIIEVNEKFEKLFEYKQEEIKKHPEIGYRILSSANQMSDIAEYTLAHHERWDGKGYPNGISEKEIPLVSRIIAVADAYDAMTSERTYRNPLSEEAAVEELRKNAGTQFDPIIVKIFTEKVLKH